MIGAKLLKNKQIWEKEYAKGVPHFAQSMRSSKMAHQFVEAMQKENIKDGKILEIGMGNGRDSRYFEREGYTVVGIDIIQDAVKMAKELSSRYNVRFLKMDANNMNFSSDIFNGVFSVGVLHGTDISKSFKEIKRVLKSGGLFSAMIFVDGKDGINMPLVNAVKKLKELFEIKDLYYIPKEERGDDHNSLHFLAIKKREDIK